MDLVVDKVSEDSYYMNLLLGLPKQLDKYKKLGLKSKQLKRKQPVPHSDICNWEHKQGILLPEDLRNFYNSCNGFSFTWTFQFGNDKAIITGKIEINPLENLIQLFGYETKSDPGVNTETERFELRLGSTSRVYELIKLDNIHQVVLVYLNSRYSPTIWIAKSLQKFYFLADDFSTYFRMAIAHLGIPNWELLFTPVGVPEWIEIMIRLLAPQLLNANRTIESARRQREKSYAAEISDVVMLNKLDMGIFKCLPKSTILQPKIIEKEKSPASPRKKRQGGGGEKDKSYTKTQRKSLCNSKK